MDGKSQYKEVKTGAPDNNLFEKVKQGLISTAEYTKRTGMRVLSGGKRYHSKYTKLDIAKFKTPVKNPKVAANVQEMHDKWRADWHDRSGLKTEPNPGSISNIKLRLGTHRAVAREHARVAAAAAQQ